MIKPEMYSEFSLKVQKNEDFALTAFIRKADIFSLLSKDILDNEGFWIRLLWFKEEYIKFLPKKFKDNIVFEEKAITKYPSLINVFPNKKKDLIYMKDLIEKNVYMISCGTDEQKDNDILAERIMNNHPSCFRYLSNRLRGKREYALLAIKENGDNIEYCSTELKNDMFLAEKALEHSLLAFEYIGEDLKKNECFILRMLKKAQEKKIDISVICRNIDQYLLEKREILEMVMKNNVNYAKKVSKNTLLSYDVMHMIITNHPEAFDIYSKKLELVNPFYNYINVSEQHSSAKIIDKMIKINPIVIKYIPRDYKNEDFYLRYKDTIESIKDELKDDYELNQLMRADHLFKQLSKEELDKENKQISIENDIINSQNPPVVIRRKKI